MYLKGVTLLLIGAVSQAQAWQASAGGNVKEPGYPERCYPDPCKGIVFTNASYVCGNDTLGPVQLPKNFPLSTELATYARFGDLCPYEFLAKWTWPNGSYHYPDAEGFVIAADGQPVEAEVTLPVGRKIDRFGSPGGNFFSPLGAPYIERALPPRNLNNSDGNYPYSYHVYEVIKELNVTLGPVAPWFEQPGMGTQFKTNGSAAQLIADKFIKELPRSEYDQREDFADNYTPGPNS
ncbi:uncharacterized protein N7496_012316 [Penicillium cataractarum]|uniref:TNT domain-containing protein n=1 Tax=Penicillium cataractarum TaxID=2100454 RepID=A0A9W9USN9_9EURO|nr:uncharacterized protein N7496_012316 [Penicillium cataractarum]KAJ5355104.1 hypothetical protein N7496_012316 [Penicillium cataractarum]